MLDTIHDTRMAKRAKPMSLNEGFGAFAKQASVLFKTLGHEGRLLILHHLVSGEMTVTELKTQLGLSQASVSQHLARLRLEGLIQGHKIGRTKYYALSDTHAILFVKYAYELYSKKTGFRPQ